MRSKKPDIEALIEKAEAGDAESQLALAKYYGTWMSDEESEDKALFWCEKAAKQDNPEAQLKMYRILSGYNKSYEDYRQALSWLKLAAKNGHPRAHSNLGNLYESGFYHNDRASKNKKLILLKDYSEAAYWYKKSCDTNDYCAYGIGSLLLEGKGTTKNYVKGLKYLLKAICLGIDTDSGYFIMKQISELYYEGKGCRKNIRESYIWALINKALYDVPSDFPEDGFIDELEKQLSLEDIVSAQEEAETRESMRLNGELTVEYCLEAVYNHIIHENKKGLSSASVNSLVEQPSDNRAVLTTWKVADIGKICVHLNQKDKNIRVTYGRHKARFGLTELFSRSALRLLIDYDKHATDGREPAISYRGNSVNAFLKLRRDNQDVVSDFNTTFRKLFGLDKDAKAFTWLPGSKARPQDKTLKIHFQLQVHYRV